MLLVCRTPHFCPILYQLPYGYVCKNKALCGHHGYRIHNCRVLVVLPFLVCSGLLHYSIAIACKRAWLLFGLEEVPWLNQIMDSYYFFSSVDSSDTHWKLYYKWHTCYFKNMHANQSPIV